MAARVFIYFVISVIFTFDIGIFSHIVNDAVTYNVSLPNRYIKTKDQITIPIMIHVDKALIKRIPEKFRGKHKFKAAMRMILNDVEKIFKHPSLNLSLRFTLIDLKILKNKIIKIEMVENVSKYLKSYGEWQGEKKIKKRRWWYSVLFTGLDLHYLDGYGRKVHRSTGRGYMNAMCSTKNSCTLLEWQPNNLPYVLAHEIAHSLGVPHDGPPHNECHGHRYIMGAVYNHHKPAKSWSPCNKRSLQQFFKYAYKNYPGEISY